MGKGFFITGTDTDIGKTVAALALMRALQDKGYRVSGFKPVSAGCVSTPNGLINADAELLQQASSVVFPYSTVNPFAFKPPIAPHIAAAQTGITIDIPHIQSCYAQIAAQNDFVIVEGAGGWLVPINATQTMADVAIALGLPVILVVGIRLGCLNHTLLTTQGILSSKLPMAGWVANHLAPESDTSEYNVQFLQQTIGAPILAGLPFDTALTPVDRAMHINADLIA